MNKFLENEKFLKNPIKHQKNNFFFQNSIRLIKYKIINKIST